MPGLVLGIDAAWTPHQPSAAALVDPGGPVPGLVQVGRSLRELVEGGPVGWWTRPAAGPGYGVIRLFAPDVVALDLPLAHGPITGRRAADQAVSRVYGSRGAATHTPSYSMPGQVAVDAFDALKDAGLSWSSVTPAPLPLFFETYPHPAIIELMGLDYRLPYKVARARRYWPDLTPIQRWEQLVGKLDALRAALSRKVRGVDELVPTARSLGASPRVLKGLEDVLDAVVCAWVGCEYLAGRAVAYGDESGAIWLPAPAER